jgi:hypothetical protein
MSAARTSEVAKGRKYIDAHTLRHLRLADPVETECHGEREDDRRRHENNSS